MPEPSDMVISYVFALELYMDTDDKTKGSISHSNSKSYCTFIAYYTPVFSGFRDILRFSYYK